MKGTGHGQCLAEETLTEYLEGGLDPALKAASEVHLVSCGECRDQLAFFMRVLQPEVTRDEAGELEVITAEWNRKPRHIEKARRRLPYAALAGVAAVLLLSVVAIQFLTRPGEPDSSAAVVQLLLERARPFEARLAGQPYLVLVRTRGTESDSEVSYGALTQELTRLEAGNHDFGRFYLLQKDFARAIPYLQSAARERGATASVHNDLGVAYLESGNSAQMEMAESEFLKALEQSPSFAPAAFNLALLYERSNATARADAQWRRYLELDSGSGWAVEAQERFQGKSR